MLLLLSLAGLCGCTGGAKPQQAWLEQSPKEIYIVNVTPPRQEVSSARF